MRTRDDKIKRVGIYQPLKIFIGKSPLTPMTSFSGGYGKDFYGNSFLLQLSDNYYIYVGASIFIFNTFGKIIKYTSPVGNNDVPYPYAIDNLGNYYLFAERIIITKTKDKPKDEDIYDYYYRARIITPSSYNNFGKPVIKGFDNIKEYYVGSDQYTMSYKPNPSKHYDMITTNDEGIKENMYLVLTNGQHKMISKEYYIDLNKRFGLELGFLPLDIIQIIEDRQ